MTKYCQEKRYVEIEIEIEREREIEQENIKRERENGYIRECYHFHMEPFIVVVAVVVAAVVVTTTPYIDIAKSSQLCKREREKKFKPNGKK